MNRAIAWYESLVSRNPEDCREEYTQLSFLRNISDDGFDVHAFSNWEHGDQRWSPMRWR